MEFLIRVGTSPRWAAALHDAGATGLLVAWSDVAVAALEAWPLHLRRRVVPLLPASSSAREVEAALARLDPAAPRVAFETHPGPEAVAAARHAGARVYCETTGLDVDETPASLAEDYADFDADRFLASVTAGEGIAALLRGEGWHPQRLEDLCRLRPMLLSVEPDEAAVALLLALAPSLRGFCWVSSELVPPDVRMHHAGWVITPQRLVTVRKVIEAWGRG